MNSIGPIIPLAERRVRGSMWRLAFYLAATVVGALVLWLVFWDLGGGAALSGRGAIVVVGFFVLVFVGLLLVQMREIRSRQGEAREVLTPALRARRVRERGLEVLRLKPTHYSRSLPAGPGPEAALAATRPDMASGAVALAGGRALERATAILGIEVKLRLYVIPGDMVNAVVAGNLTDCVVAASEGLLRVMDEDELVAVCVNLLLRLTWGLVGPSGTVPAGKFHPMQLGRTSLPSMRGLEMDPIEWDEATSSLMGDPMPLVRALEQTARAIDTQVPGWWPWPGAHWMWTVPHRLDATGRPGTWRQNVLVGDVLERRRIAHLEQSWGLGRSQQMG